MIAAELSEMGRAIVELSAAVHQNIALGLTDDLAREDAIALFRIAKCVGSTTVAQLEAFEQGRRGDGWLRLYFENACGDVVDVVDAHPSAFYSWLPEWVAQYPACSVRARAVVDGRVVIEACEQPEQEQQQGDVVTHWIPPFPEKTRGRGRDLRQTAFCGVFVSEDVYSVEPTCPRCAELMTADAKSLALLQDMEPLRPWEACYMCVECRRESRHPYRTDRCDECEAERADGGAQLALPDLDCDVFDTGELQPRLPLPVVRK